MRRLPSAAIDQLKVVGKQLDIPVFDEGQGDPVEIAKHGVDYARKNGFDLVFLDTAGRLHIDEKLMDELKNHQGRGQAHRDHSGRRCDDRSGRGHGRTGPSTKRLASTAY